MAKLVTIAGSRYPVYRTTGALIRHDLCGKLGERGMASIYQPRSVLSAATQ
jgi:hypothetical protein